VRIVRRGHALTFEQLLRCTTLAEFAPRLARARDQIFNERRKAQAQRRWLGERLVESERVLAHRELELIRSGASNSRFKIRRRQRLLEESKAAVKRYRELVAQAESAPDPASEEAA
jgi:hypothetical protein